MWMHCFCKGQTLFDIHPFANLTMTVLNDIFGIFTKLVSFFHSTLRKPPHVSRNALFAGHRVRAVWIAWLRLLVDDPFKQVV